MNLYPLSSIGNRCIVAGPDDVICAPYEAAERGWWLDLADNGILQLIYEPENALLGYAEPIQETRDGYQVAVAYALATPEQEAAHLLTITNKAIWAAQAAARKDREAKAALALPDSDDPTILRRKLNAALHLIPR